MLQQSASIQTALTESTLAASAKPRPIRHILIGPPPLVKRTIHQLHQARYAETFRWTHPIDIPDNRAILTTEPDEVMSLLVKLVRLE
ncbi:hypothetical protein [Sphaerothrix gracilis]|uniref:hypothetical protein n=1 Tax=Sphaerothrix gracilis TaxID=3151835 RepID=UPI0031FC29F5